MVSGTLTTEFAYNGAGDRVAKAVNGSQTRYTLDPAMGLVQVLAEVTGGETTTYLYGHDLLAEETTAWAWHLNDGLGSVRQLTDGAGQVLAAQGYTPFGVLLWYEGSAASAYGYTGEQEDASTGLVFLRARYYDPGMGRFISKDPFPGYVREPQTLNLYVYVANNPLGRVDPAGLQGEDWLYHLSAFITGGLTQFSLDMLLVPQDAPPGSYWLEAQPVSFQWGRLGGRLGSTLVGLLEMWSGGNLILGGGLTVGGSTAAPPAVAVGSGELVAGTALVGHGTLVILHNVDPRNQIAMATGGCGSEPGAASPDDTSPFGKLHGPDEGPEIALGHSFREEGYPGLKQFARERGALYYNEWLYNGLLPQDVGNFADQFRNAMLRTKKVHFALDGTGYPDLSGALRDGARGWGQGRYTNVELYQILHNRSWYGKTTLLFPGKGRTNTFWWSVIRRA